MPRGATNENLQEYQNKKELCKISAKTTIDQGHCDDTLGLLYDTAKDLQGMVISNCSMMSKAVPFNTVEGNRCRDAQRKFREGSGPAPSQRECSQEALGAYQQLYKNLEVFKQKYLEFRTVLQKASKDGYLTTEAVVKRIEDIHQNPAAADKAAADIGAGNAANFKKENADLNIQVADALLQMVGKFHNQSENRYRDVNDSNYDAYFDKIGSSWGELQSKAKSTSALREQAKVFLNTEEVLLATELYINDLDKSLKAAKQLEVSTEKNTNGFGPAYQDTANAAGAIPGLPAIPGGSESPGVSQGDYPGKELASGVSATETQKNPASGDKKVNKSIAFSEEKNPVGGKSGDPASSTASSRSPASKSNLREELRKKLTEKEGKLGVSGASAAASGEKANDKNGEKRKAIADQTSTLPEDGSIPHAFGNLQEQMGGLGEAPNKEDAFSMNSTKTDQAIKAMLNEFHNSAEGEQADYIGDLNGQSLFVRVKDLHERCLRKGCVTQLIHRNI